MSLFEKLPAMSDGDLASLMDNAKRLSANGSTKQQAAAKELLPAIETETAGRAAAKAEQAAINKAARQSKRRKTPAAAAPVEAD